MEQMFAVVFIAAAILAAGANAGNREEARVCFSLSLICGVTPLMFGSEMPEDVLPSLMFYISAMAQVISLIGGCMLFGQCVNESGKS